MVARGKHLAAALIDRVAHHCHIINICGNSYRLRQQMELWQALQAPGSQENRSAFSTSKKCREVPVR